MKGSERLGGATSAQLLDGSSVVTSGDLIRASGSADSVDQPVAATDLANLRRLQRAAVDTTEAILVGEAPDCAEINAIAARSRARSSSAHSWPNASPRQRPCRRHLGGRCRRG